MPEWVLIVIGVLAGIAIVAAVLIFAAWPYLQAKPPKSLLPDQKDNGDRWIPGGLTSHGQPPGDGGGGYWGS
jgi:hypothetical protein